MGRHRFAIFFLSLSLLAVSTAAGAGPRRGSGKKGSAARGARAPSVPKAVEPLGELTTGGGRGVPGSAATSGGAPPQRGPTRIDFDDRLIQGQTNKSGAVYLYDRKELQTKSMVKRRESFRQEILSTVYDTP